MRFQRQGESKKEKDKGYTDRGDLTRIPVQSMTGSPS